MNLKHKTNLKLILILLLAVVTMSARAQTLTVTAEAESLKTVLKKIEVASEYIFVYNARSLDANRVVSINAIDESIEKVLDRLFAGTEVTYKIDGRQVVLCCQQESKEETTKIDNSHVPLVVAGRILDRGGQSVIGASVIEKGTGNGVVVDFDGNYSIEVAGERSVLVYSAIGYVRQEEVVGARKRIDIVLHDDLLSLKKLLS